MNQKRRWRDLLAGGAIVGLMLTMAVPAFAARVPAGDYIGKAKAKEIALEHAGIEGEDVSFHKVKLDRDDGRAEYEVEFWYGNTEYEYDINALTGEVVSVDKDSEDDDFGYNAKNYIGKQSAKKAALKHAGVDAGSARFHKVKLDRDDGKVAYEVEFWCGSTEYDYHIDALTGDVLEYDWDRDDDQYDDDDWDDDYYDDDWDDDHDDDRDDDDWKGGQSASYIGAERAKQIVREKAGAKNGVFEDFELDWDDGRAIYEGEFKSGGLEYEFEIDACTGTVLDWEIDV